MHSLTSTVIAVAAFVALSGASGCAEVDHTVAKIGYVEAEYVYISAPTAGWIDHLLVEAGDAVSPGAALVQLATDQEAAQL
ncbi:MAG: hypothetical protein AAFX85_17070, partial [Pseudomonadota bacterium]